VPVKVAFGFQQQQVVFGIIPSSTFWVEVVLVAARIQGAVVTAFLSAHKPFLEKENEGSTTPPSWELGIAPSVGLVAGDF
jgi:hypothetical protein